MPGSQPLIKTRFFDSNGKPLNGGKLYSYQAGTSTPKATYSDPACTTPNTNPVVLDADGYCDLWIKQGSYKFVLKDSGDVQIFEKDGIPSLASLVGEVSGALMAANNLSDLEDADEALENLGLTATATELNYVDGVTSAIQTQIDTTDDKIDNHIADASAAHAGSAISNTPSGNLAATDVQAALDELQSDIDTRALDSDLDSHIADTSTHGVTGDIVGTTDTQTMTAKTFDDELTVKELSATPTAPSSGYKKIYAKDDGKVYQLNSDDIEKELGSGGGGASGKNYASDLYDGSSIDGIDKGSQLAFSVSLNSTTPLRSPSNQRLSKTASNTEDSEFEILDFTLDEADYKSGNQLLVKFTYKTSSGYATNDLQFFVKDVTAGTYQNVSNDQDGKLIASATPGGFQGFFYPNSSHSNYKLIARTINDNAAAWDFDFIDMSIGPDTLVPTEYKISESAIYQNLAGYGSTANKIPYFTTEVDDNLNLLGVVSNSSVNGFSYTALKDHDVSFTYSVRGKGSTTTEIGITLNSTELTTSIGSVIQTTRVGYASSSASVNGNTVTFSGKLKAGDVLRPHTSATASDAVTQAHLSILAQGVGSAMLSGTEINYKTAYVYAADNSGESITADTTDIPFTEVEDKWSLWDGTKLKADRDMRVLVSGSLRVTATSSGGIFAFVDGTKKKLIGVISGYVAGSISGYVDLKKGEELSIRYDQSVTLSGSGLENHIEFQVFPNFSSYIEYSDRAYLSVTNSGFGLTSSQTTPTAGWTVTSQRKVSFNTSTGEATIEVPGHYNVNVGTGGTGTAGSIVLLLKKNGSGIRSDSRYTTNASYSATPKIEMKNLKLDVGDKISWSAASSVNVNTEGGTSFLELEWMGP